MNIERNPPAFPVELGFNLNPGEAHQTGETVAQFPGMTLRDWFAGHALISIVDRPLSHGMSQLQPNSPMHPDKAASVAYRYADAMLAERAKAGGQ